MRCLSLCPLILLFALASPALAEEATYQPLNIDANGDGGVSMEEYLDVAAKIFIRADTDFDGMIEVKDTQNLFWEASIVDQLNIFLRADLNGDALISEAEMAKNIRRQMDEQRNLVKAQTDIAVRRAEAEDDTMSSKDGDSLEMLDVIGFEGDSTHILPAQELLDLRKASGKAMSPDADREVVTLMSFQNGMRARFRLKDRNGDGQLTPDEQFYGVLFSF